MTEPEIPEIKPIESQILSLLARGYNAHGIANTLHISQNYVYFLVRELRQRFLVSSNPALISRAIAEGVIQPDGTIPNLETQKAPIESTDEAVTKVIVLIYTLKGSEQIPLKE